MREAGVAKTAVWRWQERFMQEGVEGLLHDKTRPPGIPPLEADVVERVVALTQRAPPGETTHWTAGAMAQAAGMDSALVLTGETTPAMAAELAPDGAPTWILDRIDHLLPPDGTDG